MSTRRSLVQRTAVLASGLTTAAVLAVAGPSAATAADPPQFNADACEQTLLRAAEWPGRYSDGSRHVSDAFVSYLSRQPACTTGT